MGPRTYGRNPQARLRSLLWIASFFLSTSFVFFNPTRASAEACGTYQNLQVGYSTNNYGGGQPATYVGVSSNITDAGGYVLCSSDQDGRYNFSTSWNMVFGSGPGQYAQSGTLYRYGYGSCVKRWAQQTAPNGIWQDFFAGGCSSVGDVNHFWQQRLAQGSVYRLRSNLGTFIIHQSVYDPVLLWDSPLQVAFSSETYYAQSHVPGTSSYPQDFTSMQVQLSNGAFVTTSNNVGLGSYNQNSLRWGQTAVCCAHVQMWTY